jgi:uncharacterized protein HemX
MDKNVLWIVIAVVVAILLVGAVILLALQSQKKKRRVEAERMRDEVRGEAVKVDRREALADETAARARAAKAEAEAKAAEASRLEQRAAAHQENVSASREELGKQWEHADRIDPGVKNTNADRSDAQTVDGSRATQPTAPPSPQGTPPRDTTGR